MSSFSLQSLDGFDIEVQDVARNRATTNINAVADSAADSAEDHANFSF